MAVSTSNIHDQFIMINIALVLFTVGWYIFGGGLTQSIRYLIKDYRKPVPYLCVIQCTLGLISTACYVAAIAPCVQVSCGVTLMLSHVAYSLSYISVLGILLMKSYCTNRRNRFIFYTGMCLLMINVMVLVYAACVMRVSENDYVCLLDYGRIYSILRLIVDLSTHAFLSISILVAVWCQLRAEDRLPDAWLFYQILLEDGLIYGLSVCIATCISAVIVLYDVMGEYTSIIYAVNWVLVSALVSHQLHTTRVRISRTVHFSQQGKSTISTIRRSPSPSPRSRATSVTRSTYHARTDSHHSSDAPTVITVATLNGDTIVTIPENSGEQIIPSL